ncbi:hypothetical protein Q8791_23715, partial [Nocardiopsis sp. CT-R113]
GASVPARGHTHTRTRTLPEHLHTPTLHTVYDVTETTTPKPVPYGVHTTPARAIAHRDRLNTQASAVREAEEQEAREEQEKARARREKRQREEADQAAKEHTEEEGR